MSNITPAYFDNMKDSGHTILRTDCKYFYYDEDMGKSIPCCKLMLLGTGFCSCNMCDQHIDNCKGCNKYQPTGSIKITKKEAKNGLRNNNRNT